MAQAGYDPHEAVDFWQRMERSGGGGTPEFLSTHPSHGTRVKQLREWIPEATRLYDAASHAPNAQLVSSSAARIARRAKIFPEDARDVTRMRRLRYEIPPEPSRTRCSRLFTILLLAHGAG
jgi:predicted Zn-dependent protease